MGIGSEQGPWKSEARKIGQEERAQKIKSFSEAGSGYLLGAVPKEWHTKLSLLYFLNKTKKASISGSHFFGAAAWMPRFCRHRRSHNSYLSHAYPSHALPKMKMESGPDSKPLTLGLVPTDVQYRSAGFLF